VLGTGSNIGPQQCDDVADVEGDFAPSVIPCSTVPVAVAGSLNLALLTTGGMDWFACGLTLPGAASCWGGDRGVDGISTMGPVAVAGGVTFATLSAGLSSTCGVSLAGAVYCWGANVYGQLGNGTTSPSNVPVRVAGQ
jgi:regulator of chromosome condensation (RCC1) repeat-containing protein